MDSLAHPGSTASLSVRLTREEPFHAARGIEGVEVLLRPGPAGGSQDGGGKENPRNTGSSGDPGAPGNPGNPGDSGNPGNAGVLSAFTSSEGIATFQVAAPENPCSRPFAASVKGTETLRSLPGDCEVVLGVVPLAAPLLLVSVPDTVAADLGDEDGNPQGQRCLAARLLEEEQEHGKGLVYLAATRTRGVLHLRSRLAGHGFPRAPIIASETTTLRQHLSRLDLGRWKGERWAVTASREEAVDLAFHGFRVILLGTHGGSLIDGHSVSSAADWAAVKEILAGSGK